jgi:hypothetical protein
LQVHPDETDTCVDLYAASLSEANLITVDGDRFVHIAVGLLMGDEDALVVKKDSDVQPTENGLDSSEELYPESSSEELVTNGGIGFPDLAAQNGRRPGPKAVFNVNVTLDSSMDIEKLQKQLELLKRYGAI